MKIDLIKVGKRFNRDWLFRNLSWSFSSPGKYAITGPNGSGKSTLLRIISGGILYNEGEISYTDQNNSFIRSENLAPYYSLAAPYLEVIEEMTLQEFFSFHEKMKGWYSQLNGNEIINELGLNDASDKQIRYFSSGMKQRVKLAQAIFSDVPLILLDEPLTNLDEAGIELYNYLVEQYCSSRLVIVSSNDEKEYSFCKEIINIKKYK